MIPTYNGEKYIKTTLNSVIQNYSSNMEIIVLDDCSTDNTLKIAKNFRLKNLRVISSKKHLGMQINFERILKYTKGEWITVLGQDDLMLPDSLNRFMYYIAKKNNMDILVSSRSYFFWDSAIRSRLTPKLSIIRNYNLSKKINCKLRLIRTLFGFVEYNQGPQLYTGTMIKRKIIEKIYFHQNKKLFLYEIPDVSSAISILMNTKSYVKIFESLFLIGTSSNSTGIKINKILRKNKKLIFRKFNNLSKNINIPGLGVTSSHHWYCVEAYQNIYNSLNKTNINFLKKFKFLLLGTMKSNKLFAIKDRNFKKLLNVLEIQSNFKTKLSINFFSTFFKMINISKKILKNFYIIILFFTNRLRIYYNIDDRKILEKLKKIYKVKETYANTL